VHTERRWSCCQCGSLLAVERAERLHVKIGKLHYIIDGRDFRVTAVCRRCGAVTEFSRNSSIPANVGPSLTPETQDVRKANEAHRRPARKAERNDRPMDS
jgi:transcription elongation factor Elf1